MSLVTKAGASMEALIAEAAAVLRDAGIEAPRREARLLLAHAVGLRAGELVLRNITVPPTATESFRQCVARRARHEPFAYIAGQREFWSLSFEASPGILVPRPESETLIETALRLFPGRDQALRVLDLGTGSGCLLLAFLSERPNATGAGIDISPEALAVATRNAHRLSLERRAEFLPSDWTTNIRGRFDVVFANPPYIASREIAGLEPEVSHHEPALALDGGADGLSAYRQLAAGLAPHLAPGGLAFIEAGRGQASAIAGLFAAGGLELRETVCDLAGIERCVVVARPHKK